MAERDIGDSRDGSTTVVRCKWKARELVGQLVASLVIKTTAFANINTRLTYIRFLIIR